MNPEEQHKDKLFEGMEPPAPPPGLHEQVMRRTREALTREPLPDLWTRLWYSREARWAWGLGLALLLSAHLAVTPRGAVPARHAAVPLVLYVGEPGDELVQLAQLPRMRLDRTSMLPGERLPDDGHEVSTDATETNR